mgnify:FL=1
MKYYILKHKSELIDGEFLNGIVDEKPILTINSKEVLDPNYIEVEMEESDDLYINQILYKVKDGKIMKMTIKELASVYPNLYNDPQLSELELLGQMATDAELERMELGQRMTDIEQMVLEGGAYNV